MASWFKGLPGWSKTIISFTGGIIIGSITYLLLTQYDKKKSIKRSEENDKKKSEIARRVLVLGLTGAGKSSILSRSKIEKEKLEIKPTEGFNVICLQTSNMTLNIWEIGGSEKVKPYWPNFVKDTDLLVFVVDSADEKHIEEARMEFHKILSDERLRRVPILLLVNKQDLPGAKCPFDVEKQFGCKGGEIDGHPTRTLGTCAAAHLPPHPSVWEAERMMITLSAKTMSSR